MTMLPMFVVGAVGAVMLARAPDADTFTRWTWRCLGAVAVLMAALWLASL